MSIVIQKRRIILVVSLTLYLLTLSSFSAAMFAQPDSSIPQPYNPQSLNRYAFELNNPQKHVDPSGNEPVQAQLGSVKSIADQIREIEKNNPDLNAQQVLSVVAAQYPSASDVNSQQAQGDYDFSNRFVYTSEKGFIDLGHFFRNAKYPSYAVSVGLGYIVEGFQYAGFRGQDGSGFSYEDLSSNVLGTQFGKSINLDEPLSTQYEQFMSKLGGSDNPRADVPSNVMATLPQKEQSKTRLPSQKTKFTPFGKAIPKQERPSLVSRIKSLFRRSK